MTSFAHRLLSPIDHRLDIAFGACSSRGETSDAAVTPLLFYSTSAVSSSRGAAAKEGQADRREAGATIKIAHRRIRSESHGLRFYALACADPLGASRECDGDAGHALCQKRRRSRSLPGLWQRAD